MTIELTSEQHQAISRAGESPPTVLDPVTKITYVLIRSEQYDQLKALLDQEGDFNIQDAYPLMDAVAAKEGWDDPEMDSYNNDVAKP